MSQIPVTISFHIKDDRGYYIFDCQTNKLGYHSEIDAAGISAPRQFQLIVEGELDKISEELEVEEDDLMVFDQTSGGKQILTPTPEAHLDPID